MTRYLFLKIREWVLYQFKGGLKNHRVPGVCLGGFVFCVGNLCYGGAIKINPHCRKINVVRLYILCLIEPNKIISLEYQKCFHGITTD